MSHFADGNFRLPHTCARLKSNSWRSNLSNLARKRTNKHKQTDQWSEIPIFNYFSLDSVLYV